MLVYGTSNQYYMITSLLFKRAKKKFTMKYINKIKCLSSLFKTTIYSKKFIMKYVIKIIQKQSSTQKIIKIYKNGNKYKHKHK